MNPLVKKDILNVLQQAVEIIKKNDFYQLRELSDHVIHNAAIFQDKYSITIAVTIYALSKIKGKKLDCVKHLKAATKYLEEGNLKKYEDEIKHIIKDISKIDEKTNYYVEEVLERAQIKKASKIYEHGISLAQVADALGISLWDLMDYVGKTRIVEQYAYKTNVIEKIKFARELFK